MFFRAGPRPQDPGPRTQDPGLIGWQKEVGQWQNDGTEHFFEFSIIIEGTTGKVYIYHIPVS